MKTMDQAVRDSQDFPRIRAAVKVELLRDGRSNMLQMATGILGGMDNEKLAEWILAQDTAREIVALAVSYGCIKAEERP